MENLFKDRRSLIDRITPLADMVLVRRIPDSETTFGGIVIPECYRTPRSGTRTGEVLAVGRGDLVRVKPENGYCRLCDAWDCRHVENDEEYEIRLPMQCMVGHLIVYMRCPDNDVTIDGVECVLLREEQHVLGILE